MADDVLESDKVQKIQVLSDIQTTSTVATQLHFGCLNHSCSILFLHAFFPLRLKFTFAQTEPVPHPFCSPPTSLALSPPPPHNAGHTPLLLVPLSALPLTIIPIQKAREAFSVLMML